MLNVLIAGVSTLLRMDMFTSDTKAIEHNL